MSRTQEIQSADGVALRIRPEGMLDVVREVDPVGGEVGYATSCFWRNLHGAPGHILWVNQGDQTSAVWLGVA